MPLSIHRFSVLGAVLLVGVFAGDAAAQNDGKSKAAASAAEKTVEKPGEKPGEKAGEKAAEKAAEKAVEKPVDSGVARYCANVAPLAAEARIAWETHRLNELDGQVKQRIADLEKTEAETRDWVTKRETMLNAASDDVATIYSKMDPEAAAAQLGNMDDSVAVAILHKLKPGAASAILDEMDADRAAKLTSLILPVQTPEKKS